jgi:hypothetical protein
MIDCIFCVPLLSAKFFMGSLITDTRPYQSNAFDFNIPSIIRPKETTCTAHIHSSEA